MKYETYGKVPWIHRIYRIGKALSKRGYLLMQDLPEIIVIDRKGREIPFSDFLERC